MTGIVATGGVAGTPPLDLTSGPDTTAKFSIGMVVDSTDPAAGSASFMYAQAAAAQAVGTLCAVSGTSQPPIMTAVANTANLGVQLAVARQTFTAANQYGWYQLAGLAPVASNATVAPGAGLGIAGTGVAGTLAAGKQVLGCTVVASQTGTVTKTITTTAGSKQINVSNLDGLWIGQAVSGTGVAASSTIASFSGGNVVNLNNAATATGTVTGTFTYTGFTLCRLNNPFAQGQTS